MNELHVRELRPFLDAQADGGRRPLLLDVRQPWETALAAIALPQAEALSIPLHELPARAAELDPSQPVVCICHHGVRSRQAVAFLLRSGFESVYNLAGGIEAWSMEVDPAVPRY
jgi:rhodanese-related sulfurtransferase